MHYRTAAETDVGIVKETNQDSLLIKHGRCEKGEVLLAVVCDGMGGLEKGELASAAVIREFSRWFDTELPIERKDLDLRVIAGKWSLLLKKLNRKIGEYARVRNVRMGTTFTGVLFADDRYVAVHVGDSRLYQIAATLRQLTTDQTFVEREIRRGTLTVEAARTDKRRNLLLQCVGASATIEPQVVVGRAEKGAYMLCTDGFRHEISEREMYESLRPDSLSEEDGMHRKLRDLIETVKERQEKDNISAILIKAD